MFLKTFKTHILLRRFIQKCMSVLTSMAERANNRLLCIMMTSHNSKSTTTLSQQRAAKNSIITAQTKMIMNKGKTEHVMTLDFGMICQAQPQAQRFMQYISLQPHTQQPVNMLLFQKLLTQLRAVLQKICLARRLIRH